MMKCKDKKDKKGNFYKRKLASIMSVGYKKNEREVKKKKQ